MSGVPNTGIMPSTTATVASLATSQAPHSTTFLTTDDSLLSSSSRHLLGLPFNALPAGFSVYTLPRQVARLVGLEDTAARILGRASSAGIEGDIAAAVQTAGQAAAEGVAEAASQDSGLRFTDVFYAMRRLSGFFSYITSRWSLTCITVALILNRITIYASTRRHLRLRWNRRLLLRIGPIILFLTQILSLLRAIRCQTSPDYSAIRYAKPGKRLMTFEHAGGGGFLYNLSSTLLPWETDQQSCSAVNMGPPVNASDVPLGSFALLWPVFLRLCFSHFVETISCALQGRTVVTEAGMSIFEHSLAFAEAESMISHSIGLGIFGLRPSGNDDAIPSGDSANSSLLRLTRNQVLERMNVSPELLLVAMISCCNSLVSNVLDVFGKQSRFRLLNTAFWGLCFMSAIVWGLLGDNASLGGDNIGPKFPTVCIVGFVPHLLILLGVLVCMAIYALALFITAFSLPLDSPRPVSLRERFALAHENMQGANQMRSIRFNRHEDFYTTLLRIGYTSLTAASEAVFLNEGKRVVARRMTWLEEDRLAELEASRRKRPSNSRWSYGIRATAPESGELANFDIPTVADEWESGYGHEKKMDKVNNARAAQLQSDPTGIGLFRGATRCYHGFAFFRGIFFLLLRWIGHVLNKLLDGLGISARPQWLKTIAESRKKNVQARKARKESLDFWILSENGELELPDGNDFDVEEEMRKRERSNKAGWGPSEESRLDERLYDWWKAGGCWGDQDQSADYKPSDDDMDDTTSVVSMSTNADSEWEEYESDGRRTPTQTDPFPEGSSRGDAPVHESLLDMASLSRLLDPRDWESKQEARILAAHLASEQDGRILTRRRFQQQQERENARVLLSSRFSRFGNGAPPGREKRKPTPEEESEILEKLILSRRAENQSSADEQTWESGASGLGPNGPPCVVCQTSPRSIITWPCRCLCVCEECRVSLAMNNFGSCVTCRQDVAGFVRLWVP